MVGREGSVERCRQLEWQRQGEERMGRKFREMEKEKRGRMFFSVIWIWKNIDGKYRNPNDTEII